MVLSRWPICSHGQAAAHRATFTSHNTKFVQQEAHNTTVQVVHAQIAAKRQNAADIPVDRSQTYTELDREVRIIYMKRCGGAM